MGQDRFVDYGENCSTVGPPGRVGEYLHVVSSVTKAIFPLTSAHFKISKGLPDRPRAGIGVWFKDRFCNTGALAEGKTNYCKTRIGNRFAPES